MTSLSHDDILRSLAAVSALDDASIAAEPDESLIEVHLATASEDDIYAWIHEWFGDVLDGAPPIDLEPSPELQIQQAFIRTDASAKLIIRRAVRRAIIDWMPEAFSLEFLTSLASLSLNIRDSASIGPIRGHLEQTLLHASHDPVVRNTVAALIRTLGGFAPDVEVTWTLERFLDNPELDPLLAPVIVGSLAASAPLSFKTNWAKFHRIYSAMTEGERAYVDLSDLAYVLVDELRFDSLLNTAFELDAEEAKLLLTALFEGNDPVAEMSTSTDYPVVKDLREPTGTGSPYMIPFTTQEEYDRKQQILTNAHHAVFHATPYQRRTAQRIRLLEGDDEEPQDGSDAVG